MRIRAWSRWRLVVVGVMMLALGSYLAACKGTATTGATPTPTKTARPLPALATATNTPALTATPTTAPSATQTPSPSLTATPTAEPSATSEPTMTPYPTLAAGVCPFTGLPVSDAALLERRPLAIKVQNAALSRPQYGLPAADIVFEHLSEAAITRFTAIYLCQPAPARVGSVRSARFIDLEIPAMFKSLFAFSGTSPGLFPKFKEADFRDREFWYDQGIHSDVFFRDKELRAKGLPIEHTLFADPAKVWAKATELGVNQPQDVSGLAFDPVTPAGSEPAANLHIPFPSRDMVVDWKYDAASGKYLRWVEGKPHIDAATGKQLSADNVAVLYVTHVDSQTIFEDFPRTNHPSVQIQLWGTGPTLLFRDGQVVKGLWARPKRQDLVVFRDEAGQVPLPLKPGQTWIELVPLPGHRWAFNVTWTTTP